MADRDIVIEAATEDEAVKRKIFQDLCPRLNATRDHRDEHVIDFRHAAWPLPPTGRSISSGFIS